MQTVQINGQYYPFALNLRAMRLFKEKTGKGLLKFAMELAQAAQAEDGEASSAAGMDATEEIAAMIWAAVRGAKGDIDFEVVEDLDLFQAMAALTTITSALANDAPSDEGAEGNAQAAEIEATTSTSASSGASDVAA